MKKIVAFTGAGISAESGLDTFRDKGGLWDKYNINEVATPNAWKKNKKLVLDFYNLRRKNVINALPNPAHFALKSLEESFDLTIITQNIDNLHEKAGSKNIIHLHGEIMKAQSSIDNSLTYKVKDTINIGDRCKLGSQLRPNVVWFGESVPKMENAINECLNADYFIIIGTSLNVYPAANLIEYIPENCKKIIVDPNFSSDNLRDSDIEVIQKKASIGVPILATKLLNQKKTT